jgi:DNA-binding transcriptional LysR family regulator
MKYTLRQLEVFLETARMGNLSRAAQVLAMSQSAASDALKELESQFDILLFDRAGKRLLLNDMGRQLMPSAEELLSRAREIEQRLSRHQDVGRIRIGATMSIGNTLCIPLISKYRQRYSDSPVSLEVGNTETISHKVTNFELDVGMIEGEITNPALHISPWCRDELIIFCHPSHPLATRGLLTTRELAGAEWILREGGSGTRQTFDRVMHDLLPGLRLELELQHNEAIIQAVKNGMGLGCLSELTLRQDFAAGELVPLRARGRKFLRNFYLVLHQQKYRSPAIEHWLELCNEAPVPTMAGQD